MAPASSFEFWLLPTAGPGSDFGYAFSVLGGYRIWVGIIQEAFSSSASVQAIQGAVSPPRFLNADSVAAQRWRHVVVTQTTAKLEIYVDGVLVANQNQAIPIAVNQRSFLGAPAGGSANPDTLTCDPKSFPVNATIAGLAYYSRVLAPSEIDAHRAAVAMPDLMPSAAARSGVVPSTERSASTQLYGWGAGPSVSALVGTSQTLPKAFTRFERPTTIDSSSTARVAHAGFENNRTKAAMFDAITWDPSEPYRVPRGSITQIASGNDHGLYALSNGSVFSSGSNAEGQRGEIPATPNTYTVVPGLAQILSVSAGDQVSAAIDVDGDLWILGKNSGWQYPDGSPGAKVRRVQLPQGVGGLADISLGTNHAVALSRTGQVLSWGANDCGQLGVGSTSVVAGPVLAAFPPTVKLKNIDAGLNSTLAIDDDGRVWQWGCSAQTLPKLVPELSSIIQVSAGDGSWFALRSDGKLFSWGRNAEGQLGDGTTVDRTSPGLVLNQAGQPLSSVVTVSAGGNAVFAITDPNAAFVAGMQLVSVPDGLALATGVQSTPIRSGLVIDRVGAYKPEELKTLLNPVPRPGELTEQADPNTVAGPANIGGMGLYLGGKKAKSAKGNFGIDPRYGDVTPLGLVAQPTPGLTQFGPSQTYLERVGAQLRTVEGRDAQPFAVYPLWVDIQSPCHQDTENPFVATTSKRRSTRTSS